MAARAVFGLLAVCLLAATTSSIDLDLPIEFFCDNKQYIHFENTADWDTAKLNCQSVGAFLVTINSEMENLCVGILHTRAINNTSLPFWIGLHFEYENRSLGNDSFWASNSTSTYRNWRNMEPNDMNQTEDCVEVATVNGTYQWNDVNCNETRSFICEKERFYSPTSLLYDEPVYTDWVYLSQVNISCDENYDLLGNKATVCFANGSLTEATPQCPNLVCNGWTIFNYSCYNFFGEAVTLDVAESNCNSHFGHVASVLSKDENTFLSTMQNDQDVWLGLNDVQRWLDENPVSYNNSFNISHKYGKIVVQNGTWQAVSDNDTLTYICKRAYRCGATLEAPRHGSLSKYNVSVWSTATFACDMGYRLVGNATVICQSNSLWSDIPTCELVDCGQPSLTNGNVNVSNTTYNSTAQFICQDGYVLVGNTSTVCLADGNWSTIPTCSIIDCGRPSLSNGNVSYSTLTYKSTVHFKCHNGYILVGKAPSVCLANGKWSTTPVCLKNDAESIATLSAAVADLSPENFTSEDIDAVIFKLEEFTSSPDLNSFELQEAISILAALIELLEKALENRRNVTISLQFVQNFIEVADDLLDTQTDPLWLSLDSNRTATVFLGLMEKFGYLVAFLRAQDDNQTLAFSSTNVNPSNIISPSNVVLQVSTVSNATIRNLTFNLDVVVTNETSPSTVFVPSTVLSDLLADSENSTQLAIVVLVSNNLEDRLPTTTAESRDSIYNISDSEFSDSELIMIQESQETPHTPIVSILIVEIGAPFSPNAINDRREFTDPVEINYMNVEPVDDGRFRCSFWQFGSDSNPGFWSSADVTTEVRSDTNIVCSTFHITSFAVLVSVEDPKVSDALSFITRIGCGISLTCVVIAVVAFIALRSYLHAEKTFVHINFSVALMCALAFFLGGIDRSDTEVTCRIMAVMLHYFFLAVFCWMLCEGILLYLMLIIVFDTGKSYRRYFIALGWGLPLVIVAVSLGVRFHEYGIYQHCFLTHHVGLIYAFIGPMGVIILANFVIFVLALRVSITKAFASKGSKTAVKTGLWGTAVLLPILGLTWAFGALAVDSLSVTMAYLFTIFNSLQGVFVLIFHCLLDSKVQLAVRKARKKWSINSSAVFAGGSDSGKTAGAKPTQGMIIANASANSYSMSPVSKDGSFQTGEKDLLPSPKDSSMMAVAESKSDKNDFGGKSKAKRQKGD